MNKTPRTWELRLATGALALLTLQEIHEMILYYLGDRNLGGLAPLSIVLLPFTVCILAGLLRGGRLAWWCGVVLIGGLGLGLLSSMRPLIQHSWLELPLENRIIFTARDYHWVRPFRLRPFELFWVCAKIALLLAVPLLLILDEVRQWIRRRPEQP